jgi:4-alpha-glucanotransferase
LSGEGRPADALRRLATAHGVQLSYTAQGGRRVRASNDALVATLDALGVTISDRRSIDALIRQIAEERRAQPLEPVVVVDRHGTLSSPTAVPAATDIEQCRVTITREDGVAESRHLSELVLNSTLDDDGATCILGLDLRSLELPAGYHEMTLDGPSLTATTLLIAPPPPVPVEVRSFGVFAPIYGLRGRSDWGVGTFADLAELADHAGSLGAEIVGTLPMFPTFFTPPVDPSPYLPVSRQFLNELFIDVPALPELAGSASARSLLGTATFRDEVESLARLPRVDYAAVMQHKRQVLELCAAQLFDSSGSRRAEFDRFLTSQPQLLAYADFRATAEQLGNRWRNWPSQPGALPARAANPAARSYHLYAQFAAAEQLDATASATESGRAGLYLDLPVGVHPDGYDTWSQAELFAPATVGAPPDRLAPQGQAWGFPPLHPQRIRDDRYRYVINCYRHLLTHARAIRIDHVLGLQRLFWVPPSGDAQTGAYVRYRREELMAIVALEAMRAGAVVVGEDLGTVSADIRQAMDRDAMLHTFVYQFEASPTDPLPQPASPSMASFGSHDLPRFASFWRGDDIDDRVQRGATDPAEAETEHVERAELVASVEAALPDRSVPAAYAACMGALASGPAPYVMVDLADVEGETEPDNRPGTGPEADNWRWRLRRPLAEITSDGRANDLLAGIAAHRRSAEPEGVSA